jgi:hypothetical protein
MRFPQMRRIRTTNPLASLLEGGKADMDFDSMDVLARLRVDETEKYGDKEKEIPRLIRNVLEKESGPGTRLIKRTFLEEDAWLVSVECREGLALSDNGHEVFTSSRSGEMVPAILEDGAAGHFVKIRVPAIFVRTLCLPMIAGNHQ